MTTSAAIRSTQLYCGAQGLSNLEDTKCPCAWNLWRSETKHIPGPPSCALAFR
jgi:hypothetical protein